MPLGERQRPLYEIKANLFRALAHPYRIRILELLSEGEEVGVGVMLSDTGLEPPHLSQHLAVLRRYGLVASSRRGNAVYYRMAMPEAAGLLLAARVLLTRMTSPQQVDALGGPRASKPR